MSFSTPIQMHPERRWRLLLGLLVWGFSLPISVAAETAANVQQSVSIKGYMVGTASLEVTPPLGTYMAGYGPDRKATGVADPLMVKAVAVSSRDSTLIILTLDSIGLTRPDVLNVRAGIQQHIANAHVVISSTHTHAGPDVVGIWGADLWRSGRDESYMDTLVQHMIAVGVQAHARQVPATSQVMSAAAPLSWVENLSEPELLDTRLSVIIFRTEDGSVLATLTNYACHPTILGPDNTELSADYVHGFYRRMSRELEGEHLFLQGAIGGWVQPLQGDRSHQLAIELGQGLAEEVLGLIAAVDAPAVAEQEIALEYDALTIDVPLENWGFRLLIWLGVLERELYDGAMRTEVAWFQIGDAYFVTHPGETSPAYALQTRALLNQEHVFVLGLTQDAMGYILKPEYFADEVRFPHGEYLTSVSVGPKAGPMMMSGIRVLWQRRRTNGEQEHD